MLRVHKVPAAALLFVKLLEEAAVRLVSVRSGCADRGQDADIGPIDPRRPHRVDSQLHASAPASRTGRLPAACYSTVARARRSLEGKLYGPQALTVASLY